MKKIIAIIIFTTLFFGACQKSIENTAVDGFTWTFEGVTYKANFDTAFQYSITPSGFPLILAGTGVNYRSPGNLLGIQVTSFNVGTHIFPNIAFASGLTYQEQTGTVYKTYVGEMVITENTNSKISGHFSGLFTLSTGINKSITGRFTRIQIY